MINYKKIAIATIVAIIFTFAFFVTHMENNISAQPGSETDPLVSRSYLEERLRNFSTSEYTLPDELLHFLIEDITNGVVAMLGGISPTTPPQDSMAYVPINVLQNQTLVGAEGTEIIVRGGNAVTFSMVADGLVNATTGTELFNGDNVPLNNILIVSRDDGRGVTVTSSNAWLLVRGDFEIRQYIITQ